MTPDLSRWAFDNRKLIYFLVAVLVVGGAYSCYEMSKLEDPEIKVKQAMVIATYPGASAHQVELEVTDVLEKAIRTMGNVDNTESYSYADMAIIQVELLTTVPDADVEQCWDKLRRRVETARQSLPSGASVMVRDDFGDVFGMFYALTGEGLSDRRLTDYAELVKREVSAVEGINRVDLYGGRDECIYISMLQDRMANLGVRPFEVLATINGQNATTYSGYYESGSARIRVDVSDKFRTVDDIGSMIIEGHDDDRLRLRDIATIEKGYADPTRNEMFYDGERAIGILIAASPSADIVKVGAAVEDVVEQLKQTRLPVGVGCHKIFFQSDRVADSLGTFVTNLIESVAIVVLVLMLVMGFRSGIIIGTSLVVTVLGSFLFLLAMDGTMQRVSLASFVLAMGMLVDNAIVIIDGILVDLKAGKSRREAMCSIGRRTAMPLLGATTIAIIAFLPIFLSPDTAGVYTRDLFIVLAVSLLLSWVLALLHVPLMADRWLNITKRPTTEQTTTDDRPQLYQGRAYAVLRRCLTLALSHRLATVVVMVVLLVLSVVGYGFLRQGFFPDMTYDQMYMEYRLPEGSNFTRVEHDLAEIEQFLKSRDEVTHVTKSVGGTPGRYCLVRSVANPSLAYGELIIDFTSAKALERNMDEIQAYLTDRYPDAYVKLKRYNLMFKKYPIEAQFIGPDPAVLHALTDSAMAIMRRSDKVHLITTDWDPPVATLSVDYDQASARALGMSRTDVATSLLAATGGIPIGTFYEGIYANTVYLKCLDADGTDIGDLSNAQIFNLLHETPLRQIASGIDIRWEDPVVPRYNGQRSQRAQCSPVAGTETEDARSDIAAAIESIPLPAGYQLVWQGEKNASDRSMKYLFAKFPLAVILMIAILIMLFKGYRKPVIIFCCLPFIIVGVVAVMLLTGKTFNFVAIVGTLGLMGMLVKNGIVLMDEIGLQLSQGIEPTKALIDSAQSRLRPVMMASLTTILGMIPLLWDSMFGSLAASIMGGLLFGTLITLLFIPVLYALFFGIKPTDGGADSRRAPHNGPDLPRPATACLVVLLALCLPAVAKAQTDTLTIAACRQMALDNNKELAAARYASAGALHTAKSYKGNFLPDIGVSGAGLYSTADGRVGLLGYNLEYEIGAVLSGGLSVTQPIYAGGKIAAAYNIAKIGSEAAQTQQRLTTADVIRQTDNAYVQLVEAQEMVKVARSNQQLLDELMRSVESAYRHGMRPRNDVLKVQVKLNEAELLVSRADNAVQLASMNLCHCIGLPLDTPVAAEGLFTDSTRALYDGTDQPGPAGISPDLPTDISLRPEYTLAEQQVAIARQQVKLSRAELLPQVGIQAGYNYVHGGEINDHTLIDKGIFNAMLTVSIPLFHFGERHNKVSAAKAKLLQARTEQQDAQEKMRLELAQAAINLDEARREVDIANRSLVQAEENRRVSRRQYDGGMESLADHLEAQTLWQQASAQRVEAHCNLYIAYIDYLKAQGTLY